jgi:hypothetical protein
MTVPTFPITFPLYNFVEASFMLGRRQAAGMLEGGRDVIVDRGRPQWRATWKTPPLKPSEANTWQAWGASLRGSARTFLGWDPYRPYPLTYMPTGWGTRTRAGGGTFDGTATLTAISTNRDEITVGTLFVGMQFVPGDMVSLSQSGNVSLHQILGTFTADGSGSSGAMWIEPEVPATFTTAAAVNFYRPCAKFRLLAPPVMPVNAKGGYRQAQFTFDGISVL